MNATIHASNAASARGKRRRRQTTGGAPRPLWRLSREYLLFLLVLASNRSCGGKWALAMDLDTVAPSLESTIDSTLDSTYAETTILDLSEVPTGSIEESQEPTAFPQPTQMPTVEKKLVTFGPTTEMDKRQDDDGDGTVIFVPTQSPTSFVNSTDYNSTSVPTYTTQPTFVPTESPTLYKKTAPPTLDPSNENSPEPTMVDTNNRQDTPGPAGGGSVPVPVPTDEPTYLSFEPVETQAPSKPPTRNPTASPTPQPTVAPTPRPTPRPTKQPTERPTSAPTRVPTPTPTRKPTRPPTNPPTETPSSQPSASPTRRPTPFPTKAPVPWPTPRPTPMPTPAPTTAQPTPRPTTSPSSQPSNAPSVVTPSPTTMEPSETPSTAPSVTPTLSPQPTTKTPKPSVSSAPSGIPSVSPTNLPSVTPSDFPSRLPSNPPSMFPSASPSEAPSLSLQSSGERVVMTLRYSDILQGLSIIKWEQITATHIRESIVNAGVEPAMEDLRVWTNIIRQTPDLGLNSPQATMVPQATAILVEPEAEDSQDNGLRRRSLQETTEVTNFPLEIAFDTAVSYRSLGQDHDIQILISGAFDTDEDREKYVSALKKTNDGAFQNLDEVVSVSVGGVDIPVEVGRGGGDGQDMTVFIIIGVSAVLGALLLLTAFFLWRSYYYKSHLSKTDPSSGRNGSNANGVTTEIVVEHNPDEVSTLGDPMYSPNGMMMAMMNADREEERTASVGDDYDYKYLKHHNFGGNTDPNRDDARSRMMSEEDNMTRESSGKNTNQSKLGLSHMGESIFSDDASFEEQYCVPEQAIPFEITVPAGKLGMVIDTPNGGFPIVHAIKDTSVLAERVLVGDRLVSVDGQDCTTMTAVQVSKLISLKSDQESRILVFVRHRITRPSAAGQ